ncbi:uncharacterized protein LOC133785571 [Humulus lupulus]|uniref:uncharacterized protein LOC133785571 n=1 Tax=Humulus lupulus TaxID=3486 RepID=UPI002B40DA3D|nr:uncharacterized protein LOC133785571 [Humulus lupulus]
MAKTKAKIQGKSKSAAKKPKKRGPTSTSDVQKTKTMEAVLGIEPIDFSDEEDEGAEVPAAGPKLVEPALRDGLPEPLSPNSSLRDIQRQEEIRSDFAVFLAANRQCVTNILQGKSDTPPILRSGIVIRNLGNSFTNAEKERKVKITMEDIEEEVAFWNSSMVCYVLGANPPLSIFEGFIRRMWKDKVDKVGLLSYGVFLIRFETIEDRDEVLNGGYIFLNKRPMVMKAWDPNTNFKKEDVRTVPIWIQISDLDLKYWGEKLLFKIVGQLGKPVQVDLVTKERNKLNFPRVLIEVSLKQDFPELIYFEDEYGCNVSVSVMYEWKPIVCGHCKGMGHTTDICRKKEGRKQQWVVKEAVKEAATNQATQEPKVYADGFQQVTKGRKYKDKESVMETQKDNSFQALAELPGSSNTVSEGVVAEDMVGRKQKSKTKSQKLPEQIPKTADSAELDT